MSLQDEIERVHSLRESGLTIHQIAAEVGRSAGWVYTRLNSKYTPKRKRATPDTPPDPIGPPPADGKLAQELDDVRKLRHGVDPIWWTPH